MTDDDPNVIYYKHEINRWQQLAYKSNLQFNEIEFTDKRVIIDAIGSYKDHQIKLNSQIKFKNVPGKLTPESRRIFGEAKLIIPGFSEKKFKLLDEPNFKQSLSVTFGWRKKDDHPVFEIYYKKRKPQILERTLNELFSLKVKWVINTPEQLEVQIHKHLSPSDFKAIIETLEAIRRGFERIL